MGNTLKKFEFFMQLPPELMIAVLKNCDFQQCYNVRLTCKYLYNLIEENQKSLALNEFFRIDLEKTSIRAWRKTSSTWWREKCQIIPIEHISNFFYFVNVKVLNVSALDEETCAFLTEHAKNKNLRFEHLRLFHSLSASHESICQLLKAAKCRRIHFRNVRSKLTLAHFEMEQFKNLESLWIERDDSIGEEFFDSILSVCNAKKFIFDNFGKLPQRFVREMFEKWLNGSRELEAVRITTKLEFSIDEVFSGLSIRNVDRGTWSMKNAKGEEATITACNDYSHFPYIYHFLVFNVNTHNVEDTIYEFNYEP